MLKAEKLALDVERIRQDFPILKRRVHGKRLVYLDNAATSQKPRAVIDATTEYYETYNANIHRAVHKLSEEATEAYEGARKKAARFINARSPEEVIFVRSATEAINLVMYSWGRDNIRENDKIVLTEMEHHSNLVPWQLLAKEKNARLEFLGFDSNGLVSWEDVERYIDEQTKLVSITQMSNVLGTIPPIKRVIDYAHRFGAKVVIDGAQGVAHLPVDVQELDCDFLAFSGHKMLGPTGVGVLYGKRELLQNMPPFHGGGEMIKEVHLRESRWNDLPWKFEAGTVNIAGGIGLGVAIDYLNALGMNNVREHEIQIARYALESLSKVKGLRIYGPVNADQRGGVIAFNLGDIHSHDLASILDAEGIAVRSGHHCAMPLHEKLRIPASTRASFYIYNTFEEVDLLVKALGKARKIFGQ